MNKYREPSFIPFLLAFILVMAIPPVSVSVFLSASEGFLRPVLLSDFKEIIDYYFRAFEGGYSAGYLVFSFLTVLIVSLLLNIVLGVAAGLFINEFLTRQDRRKAHFFLNVFASMPVVLYGAGISYFLHGSLVYLHGPLGVAVMVSIMCLPLGASLADNSLRKVPQHIKEAAYSAGASTYQTARYVIIPNSLNRLLRSIFSGIARVVTEFLILAAALGYFTDLAKALVGIFVLTVVLYSIGASFRKLNF